MMPTSPRSRRRVATALSAFVPGLGHMLERQWRRGAQFLGTTLLLILISRTLGRLGGQGADIFFLMLIVLPWWVIQAYDASLVSHGQSSSLRTTLRTIWREAHDIRFLGALFLLTAVTDFYIIVANPTYALTIFCSKPAGALGILAKAQSPTLHVLIGYGFLRLRRWSLLLYLAYAAFGLMNGAANSACFGYGRVRMVFLVTLVAFTGYVVWRRRCFTT